MTIPKFDQLTGNESLPQLIEMVAKLQKQVQWLMDGKIGSDNIRANSIVAEKMDVNELSAITADMGKLTSGEIYGAYIATREASYPRAEMSNTNNLFGAYKDANNSLEISPAFGGGAPALFFKVAANIAATMMANASNLVLNASARDLELSTDVQGNIRINPETGYFVVFPQGFSAIQGAGTENLAVELASKATAGISTGSSGSHNHGIPNGTVLMVNGGGTVTFNSAPAHTHSQT